MNESKGDIMFELKNNFESFGTIESRAGCRTYYVRKKGRSHVEKGTLCQDYCLVKNIGEDIHVIAVADGHGGEAYIKSDVGSGIACEVLYDLVKRISSTPSAMGLGDIWLNALKTKEFKTAYIQEWKKSVLEEYNSDPYNEKESQSNIIKKYGTTILFAVVTKKRIVIGQLGDGAILLFNESNQCQLFKRHMIKTSSRTSSLASSRAEYAFIIDALDRDTYSHLLISTDGIYDKLDTENSFLIYANSLLEQLKNNQCLAKPFDVENIDVSEISKDDCTIALMISDRQTNKYELTVLEKYGYENIEFIRSMDKIDLYRGKKGGDVLELHVVEYEYDEVDLDLKTCKLLQAVEKIKISKNKNVYVYIVPQNAVCIQELIEHGDHLEKRYWFNENDYASMDDDEYPATDEYSNEFWLDVYAKVKLIENEFNITRVLPREYLFCTAYITAEKEMVIFSDALSQKDYKKEISQMLFKEFLDHFSIIGKLSCGEISIPLFKCNNQGQNIIMLHTSDCRKPLCRVIYNQEKNIYGLWNATGITWNIEGEKRKEIVTQGVLRLNRNHVFSMPSEEKGIVYGAEIIDGFAKYQVMIF